MFNKHLDGKERAGCLTSSSWYIVVVLLLFFTVPWVDLSCMIVVFSDHFSDASAENSSNRRDGRGIAIVLEFDIDDDSFIYKIK